MLAALAAVTLGDVQHLAVLAPARPFVLMSASGLTVAAAVGQWRP
jgi:hypothetical protein